DITGSLPTPQATEEFLKDHRSDRRRRLVDRLLDSPEYVDFRSLQLSDRLRVNSQYLRPEGAEIYYLWIHDQVAANTPWDEMVRQLLEANGPSFKDGPANYYRVAGDPTLLAETTAQTFLGVRMQCAR